MSGNLKERLNESLTVAAQLWEDIRAQNSELSEIGYELSGVTGKNARCVCEMFVIPFRTLQLKWIK